MKLAFSLILNLCSIHSVLACKLDASYEYVALSAPISVLMKELGVLNEVKFIGSFHPYVEDIKRVDGGIFLRLKSLKLNKNSILFYDKSQNLVKELKSLSIKKESIATNGFSAVDATSYLLKKIKPYLLNCNEQISEIKTYIKKTKSKVLSQSFSSSYLFFLGSISEKRNTNLIIANDGIVLDLKTNKEFSSYPTDLAYVSWSAKILKKMKNKLFIGIVDSDKEMFKKVSHNRFNLSYPGALIPGYSQISLLNYFIDNIQGNKDESD